MYIPPAFRIAEPAKLAALMQRYGFATLITHDGAAPFASHLPMLFHPEAGGHGALVAHMARANPQWRHFTAGHEVLVVFHGPHSYISPSWYGDHPAVPTWNYATVHAYGIPAIIEDHERIVSILHELVVTHESSFEQPWPDDLPEEYRDRMIHGIVAFEIPITRLEGKFKLGQNRSAADIQGVFNALSRSADPDSRALAQLMLAEGYAHENA